MKFYLLSLLLALLAFSQSYIWTKKKNEKKVVPVVRAPNDGDLPMHKELANTILEVFHNGDWSKGTMIEVTRDQCLPNIHLGDVVCPKFGITPTCALYSSVGVRIYTCADVRGVDRSVFMVPSDRVFMLPTKGVGHVLTVDHLNTTGAVTLETLSVHPRVFRMRNFVTVEETDALIESAKQYWLRSGEEPINNEADNSDARTSAGKAGADTKLSKMDIYRTAQLAFDIDSPAALAIKNRLFQLLGFQQYVEALTDGFQTLHYSEHGAYVAHIDWVEQEQQRRQHQRLQNKDSNPSGNLAENTKKMKNNKKKGLDTAYGDSDSSSSSLAPPSQSDHNYDSAGTGTNRYVTLLLYLTDVPVGGETVFTEVSHEAVAAQTQFPLFPLPQQRQSMDNIDEIDSESVMLPSEDSDEEEIALIEETLAAGMPVDERVIRATLAARKRTMIANAYLEARNATSAVAPGSWQHDLLGHCRTHLAAAPVRTEALLFYSQYPNGTVDMLSRHGACPVLQGDKWVANMWVWNGPRNGYKSKEVNVTFESLDVEGALLYWDEQMWEVLSPGRAVLVSTYTGHRWSIRMRIPTRISMPSVSSMGSMENGEKSRGAVSPALINWVVSDDSTQQHFVVTRDAINKALQQTDASSGGTSDGGAKKNGSGRKQNKKSKRSGGSSSNKLNK